MNTILYKSTHLGEVIDADEKMGIVKGYGSIFGNVDSDGDIINKGAYRKTIQENGSRVKYLYQHDMDKPIGKMVHLEEDEKGLVFEAQVPKTRLGMDVIELMKAGVITENSVGILPIQKSMSGQYREINEVKLFEVSAVTLAANDQAMIVDVKGNNDPEKIFKRFDNMAKLIRKGDISDELGYALEAEIYKLKSLYVKATLPTIEVTEPTIVKSDDNQIYNYLYNRLKN
jgi:HK97 family phage prohead protease